MAPVTILCDERGRIIKTEKDVNLIFTRAGAKRSGDIHPNTQYDYVVSGEVMVTRKLEDGSSSETYKDGETIEIKPNVPHLFEFFADTLMLEWWSSKFKYKYYKPYRDIVEGKNEKRNNYQF
jgi:quercetin dioxygenase-like cupin family protein